MDRWFWSIFQVEKQWLRSTELFGLRNTSVNCFFSFSLLHKPSQLQIITVVEPPIKNSTLYPLWWWLMESPPSFSKMRKGQGKNNVEITWEIFLNVFRKKKKKIHTTSNSLAHNHNERKNWNIDFTLAEAIM